MELFRGTLIKTQAMTKMIDIVATNRSELGKSLKKTRAELVWDDSMID